MELAVAVERLRRALGAMLFGDGEVNEVAATVVEVCGGVLDNVEAASTGLEFGTEATVCGEGISLAPECCSRDLAASNCACRQGRAGS